MDLFGSTSWFSSFDRAMIAFLQWYSSKLIQHPSCILMHRPYAYSLCITLVHIPYASDASLCSLKEFGEYAESTDPSLKLPYAIEGEKIGVLGKPDKWYAIKKRFNGEDKWTNALKYMLTNLKWLVAWLCRTP